ncbi:uncharacterized protein LOC110366645 isoform X2 [Fundulus heteroclitus]|uniref:uncharacterized protein LOC110366645 isoform X2 n=1 Tax=Fundulus heteroclitus TaxID=8078 RepID=UPI00165ABB3C|nr:uncharacterized protein LOC110366645 isoform X2 [Fundulus heteroclitus]
MQPFPAIDWFQVEVDYGEPALLHCNGSALTEEEGAVYWESRGEDVAVLREGKPWVSERFKDRIQLPADEQIREGNWSLVLRQTKLRDADVYECLLQETKPISTVWLSVNEPVVRQVIAIPENYSARLSCFIKPEREPLRSISWTLNGKVFFHRNMTSGFAVNEQDGFLHRVSEEEFYLHIQPPVSQNGTYQCWYTTGESGSPKLGIPESYLISVIPAFDAVADAEETSTDDLMGPVTLWTEEVTTAGTLETSTDHLHLGLSTQTVNVMEPGETSTVTEQIRTSHEGVLLLSDEVKTVEATGLPTGFPPVRLEKSTQRSQDGGNLLPEDFTGAPQTEVLTEKETVSDNDNLDTTWNVFQLETFPWIRVGLIGGVLLITAVVLCVLRALGHI